MKKKMLSLLLVPVLAMLVFTGCGFPAAKGTDGEKKSAEAGQEKYRIVCTTYPQYDCVMNLVGQLQDKFDVSYLMESGVDLHSYRPSASDMARIEGANLFIYVGGESDGWVEDALKDRSNHSIETVNMLEALGDGKKEEEVVEGMQTEEEEEEEGQKEPEYDEHVWLSLKNAQTLVTLISDKMKKIDPSDADAIAANTQDYVNKLRELDERYENEIRKSGHKVLLFGDRFPFRYLIDDYGLKYYAAFVGCSAETEASFQTISFLAKKADELHLPVILTIEKSDQKIASTIRENTREKNQKIMAMDSLQSVSRDDIEKGKTYLKSMENNLEVLKAALN